MKTLKKTFLIPPTGDNPEQISHYSTASSWAKETVCFNIINNSYPTLHTHEYYELMCVFSGSIVHKINGMKYVMYSGDCCLIRPDDCHCMETIPQSKAHEPYLSVNFLCQPDYFEQVLNVLDTKLLSFILNDNRPLSFSISATMLARIKETCLDIQTPSGDPSQTEVLVCKMLIVELISQFVQSDFAVEHNSFPDWLQDFILTLHDPGNFQKKIDELIDGIPYSYSYIQKQFKQHLETSIVSYVNSVKISYAKNLLASTKITVTEIAFQLGFNSVAHLNHLFKKNLGISPMEFRKQNKK